MDSVHHIWCPLSSQEYQDLPDGAETTLTYFVTGKVIVMTEHTSIRNQPDKQAVLKCSCLSSTKDRGTRHEQSKYYR
ncbi:MAG: hypothetical protein EOM46_18075 [Gammaproteobacteria bacterium]|nr:hypothetical protein [Gammaproteobacteria bacterium]